MVRFGGIFGSELRYGNAVKCACSLEFGILFVP